MIKKFLKKEGECSTVRCCDELGKYKEGDICKTPWGDLIKIVKVERYLKMEKIPTFNQMDEIMKISLKSGKNKWDYIEFKLK